MNTQLELLRSIRSETVSRAIESLTNESGFSEELSSQIEWFFNLLELTVIYNDPKRLDPIITEWSNSQTQTDLESNTSTLSGFLNQLMLFIHNICKEKFSTVERTMLADVLIPAFGYAFEKASTEEIQSKLKYSKNKMSEVQNKIERLEQSKSAFITIAAHELRTPLTLIEGYTSMLDECLKKDPGNPPELQLLNGIQTGTQRLQTVINDMLDVSLIDNNLLKISYQPVWLNIIFKKIEKEFSQVLSKRNQTFIIQNFPGIDKLIYLDPDRIKQVFHNILENAIKFTPDGGTIKIDGRILPNFIEITIQDTGIGISRDEQPAIFEKFSAQGDVSLHSSSRTKFMGGGPGLGLFIAKGIVEAHGGGIWAESPIINDPKYPGSVFHILVPNYNSPPNITAADILSPLTQE